MSVFRRLVSTFSLAILGLVLLAWPFSYAGLGCVVERTVSTRWQASLADGNLVVQTSAARTAQPLERDHYFLTSAESARDSSFILWPKIRRTPGSGSFMLFFPLALPALAATLVLALATLRRAVVTYRRRARAQCLACGYERIGESECQECGLLPAQAAQRTSVHSRRVLRDAGWIIFATLFTLSGSAWLLARADRHSAAVSRAQAFDYSWYLQQCTPRLDGSVAYASPGAGPDSLAAVLRRYGAGTTIVLLPGVHDLGGGPAQPTGATGLSDVWLLGSGRDKTTLSLHLYNAAHLRIENLTIDCHNDPFVDLRATGSLAVRNCLVKNYNSGAGGSSALDAVNSVVLVEQCEFEGKSGRSSPQSHGVAMDLRADTRVFVRDTVFTNNQEVFRNASGVLDGCTATTDQPQWFYPPSGERLLQRNVNMASRIGSIPPNTFKESLDDLEPLQALSDGKGVKAWTDPIARQKAQTLNLAHDKGYWTRLLLHPSPQVRALARAHAPSSTAAPDAINPEDALRELGRSPLPFSIALKYLNQGESVLPTLESLRASGSGPAQANAAALLQLLSAQPPLPDIIAAQSPEKP
jgi:hypothetical protein